MKYHTLPRTDLNVSLICLGTMTWGEQNTEAEAHEQLDYALDQGVNFIDTAEMYPVPPKEETYGFTEDYIGTWLASRKCRDKVILASKIAGPFMRAPYIRNGENRLNRSNIEAAIEESLRRLQTDYLDIYQLHWPDRHTMFFGEREYDWNAHRDDAVPLQESLEALADLVKAGKVRYVGLSNETPWGTMRFLELAKELDLPRVVTIQNPYSLLNRIFDGAMSEVCRFEELRLLAYSPLAFGRLSGKYHGGAMPEKGRITLFPRFDRYNSEVAITAVDAYAELARGHGLDPAQMALAWVNARPHLGANIIGATTMEQLKTNIASIDIELSPEVIAGIQEIHARIPNPCP
ncbi:MAG: NADP(H)-dependent aldo-keto reductase [Verrucomicrobiota bacterium]